MIPNLPTEEGQALGKELARLCDIEAARNPGAPKRCRTCAFRAGDHVANGSPATLMDALKCVMERKPFWCHEIDEPGTDKLCAGWRAMVSDTNISVPWDFVGGQ